MRFNMPLKCVNSAGNFWYICGQVTLKSQKWTIMSTKAYTLFFGCEIGDQDKAWAPHICCISHASGLCFWLNKKRSSMGFAIPMITIELSNHMYNHYFCMTTPLTYGISNKDKSALTCPNIPSTVWPAPHGVGLSVPIPLESYTESNESSSQSSGTSSLSK